MDSEFLCRLTIGFMKEWGILDDVKYKYFKELDDDDEIVVHVYYIDDDDRPTYCTAVFNFDLKYDCSGGSLRLEAEVTFDVKKTYNTSSPFALMLIDLQEENDKEESEEEEEEEEEGID